MAAVNGVQVTMHIVQRLDGRYVLTEIRLTSAPIDGELPSSCQRAAPRRSPPAVRRRSTSLSRRSRGTLAPGRPVASQLVGRCAPPAPDRGAQSDARSWP